MKYLLTLLIVIIFCGLFFPPRTIIIKDDLIKEYKIITAYNPVKSQTDHTPCISASGLNVCKMEKLVCACSREYEFGTKFLINGQVWECYDRLARKYDNRIDLLMYNYKDAKEFGKQLLEVIIIN